MADGGGPVLEALKGGNYVKTPFLRNEAHGNEGFFSFHGYRSSLAHVGWKTPKFSCSVPFLTNSFARADDMQCLTYNCDRCYRGLSYPTHTRHEGYPFKM